MKNVIKTLLKKFLKTIHHSMPSFLQRIYMPFFWKLVYFFNHSVKTCFHTYLPVITFEANQEDPEKIFRIAYVGTCPHTSNYWADTTFPDGHKSYLNKKEWIWNIIRELKINKENYAFAVIEINALFKKLFFFKMPVFQIPPLIHLEFSIDKPIQKIIGKRIRDYERCIRKYDLSYEICNDPVLQKDFYYNMYVPFVKHRHKNSAILTDYHSYLKCHENGKLLMIKNNGERVAGGLLEYIQDKAYFRIMGIKDGNLEIMKLGVIGAIYYYLILEAQKDSYKCMHIGGSRPLLSDGVTHYKMEMYPSVVPLGKSLLRSLVLLKDSPPLRNFLANHSFLYTKDGKNLCYALFPLKEKTDLEENFSHVLQLTNYLKGVREINIFSDPKNPDLKLKLPSNSFIKPFKNYFLDNI